MSLSQVRHRKGRQPPADHVAVVANDGGMRYRQLDDVIGLAHSYGCGVAIDAPDAVIPIRRWRHISLNPNFGGELRVVSLGCKKPQPERLLPPGSFAVVDGRGADARPQTVCPQDDRHVGVVSMLDDILQTAKPAGLT